MTYDDIIQAQEKCDIKEATTKDSKTASRKGHNVATGIS